MKEKLIWTLFVVAAAALVAAAVGYWLRREGVQGRVPDFTLDERSGKPLTRRDLLGHVWVADFIFTRCQATCPVLTSLMYGLDQKFKDVKFVSFSVDPDHDTPERLREFAENNRVATEDWFWATGKGKQVQELAGVRGFQLGGSSGEEIVHSNRLVLVDRYGRIRGTYPVVSAYDLSKDLEQVAKLEADLARVLAEPAIPIKSLPKLNAGLNASSAFLLLVGLAFIKMRRIGAHRTCMLAALLASTLFLISYLVAHHYLGATPYTGQGAIRTVYFAILISHTILAAFIVPLAGIVLYRAFREQFDRHKRLARWVLPLWLYVSVTGVVIYFMLYAT